MNRIFTFLGGALAGAGVLAAVACAVTHLTEEAPPKVADVTANSPGGCGETSPHDTDKSAERA